MLLQITLCLALLHACHGSSAETNVPGRPRTLRVRPSTDSIVVIWTAPSDSDAQIKGYTLQYGADQSGVWNTQMLHANQRVFTIRNPDPDTEYAIMLRAFNRVGNGRPIFARTITRKEQESSRVPMPPVGVRAIILSSTSVRVQWSSVGTDSENRSFTVRYKQLNGQIINTVESTDKIVLIDNLTPNQTYTFGVRSTDGRRTSVWSMPSINKTEEAPRARQLTFTAIDDMPHAVNLSWTLPETVSRDTRESIAFVIFYTDDPTTTKHWTIFFSRVNWVEISYLRPNTTYHFKVRTIEIEAYMDTTNLYSEMAMYTTGNFSIRLHYNSEIG